MPLSKTQKDQMIARAMGLARQLTDWNRSLNAFMEEYFAEDYGNEVTTNVLDASPTPGLTQAEWVDGVGAMDSVSSAIETNKTNLYRLAR